MPTHQRVNNRPTTQQPTTTTETCINCGSALDRTRSSDQQPPNHCPRCLHSRHVVDRRRDEPSTCRAPMEPIAVATGRSGRWRLVHRCSRCGDLDARPVAEDDNQLLLVRLAVRPLAQPPFPLEPFGDL